MNFKEYQKKSGRIVIYPQKMEFCLSYFGIIWENWRSS